MKIKDAKKYYSSNINKNIKKKKLKYVADKDCIKKNTNKISLDLKKIDNAKMLYKKLITKLLYC